MGINGKNWVLATDEVCLRAPIWPVLRFELTTTQHIVFELFPIFSLIFLAQHGVVAPTTTQRGPNHLQIESN